MGRSQVPKPNTTYGRRRCRKCNAWLSRYNPRSRCWCHGDQDEDHESLKDLAEALYAIGDLEQRKPRLEPTKGLRMRDKAALARVVPEAMELIGS